MLESGEVFGYSGGRQQMAGCFHWWSLLSHAHKLNFCCDVGFPNQAALACEMHSHSKGIFKSQHQCYNNHLPKAEAPHPGARRCHTRRHVAAATNKGLALSSPVLFPKVSTWLQDGLWGAITPIAQHRRSHKWPHSSLKTSRQTPYHMHNIHNTSTCKYSILSPHSTSSFFLSHFFWRTLKS